ncbi:MAG: DUF1428 domain-containing protein [Granulosicoccaceae bacterium]
MSYVDGFLAAVPTANKEEYLRHARSAAVVFKEYGAINLVENWGVDVPEGKRTSMPLAVQCKDNEVVVFSWITWPDKATRDIGMAAAMADPRLQEDVNPMPFDGHRMIFGGFETLLSV